MLQAMQSLHDVQGDVTIGRAVQFFALQVTLVAASVALGFTFAKPAAQQMSKVSSARDVSAIGQQHTGKM